MGLPWPKWEAQPGQDMSWFLKNVPFLPQKQCSYTFTGSSLLIFAPSAQLVCTSLYFPVNWCQHRTFDLKKFAIQAVDTSAGQESSWNKWNSIKFRTKGTGSFDTHCWAKVGQTVSVLWPGGLRTFFSVFKHNRRLLLAPSAHTVI